MTRFEWARACQLARTGGTLTPTLPHLRAAYLIVTGRQVFPPDPSG